MLSLWELSGAVFGIMAAGFIFATLRNYYSFVDALWGFCFSGLALLIGLTSTGDSQRKLLGLGILFIWGTRIGWHLAVRLFQHYPNEDSRYIAFKSEWGRGGNRARFHLKFLGFFGLQGLSILGLIVPFVIVSQNTDSTWHTLETVGLAISVFSIALESLADHQLKSFKKVPSSRGHVCDQGLWRYSRHPNYFFEWLHWIGIAIFASSSPHGMWAWIAPALISYLLLFLSGVPLAEAQSLKSKGDRYRDYQARTSVFIPWFPKNLKRTGP